MSVKQVKPKSQIKLAGRQKFSSFKDYLKHLEETLGQVHLEAMKKVAGGKK